MNKCKPTALGVSIGVVWSACAFFLGITAMFGWGNALVSVLSSLYIGYAASIGGAIVGAVWAFIDGWIAGVLIAIIYNKTTR